MLQVSYFPFKISHSSFVCSFCLDIHISECLRAIRSFMQVGKSDSSFPIQKKRVSREFLRTKAHLRPRTSTFGAV